MGFDTHPSPFRCGGNFTLWAPLCLPCLMETETFPTLKLPHSSSCTPQNLLKAEGKGRLIKKEPYLPACSTARGRESSSVGSGGCEQHPAPARMLGQGKQTHRATRPALRRQQDHFIRSLLIKNKHTTFKKKKKKIPAKLGLTQLRGGPALAHKRCIPKWKCSVPQR